MSNLKKILGAVAAASAIMMTAGAPAQEAKHYRFAYDQPKTTGYGILGDIFSDKLKWFPSGGWGRLNDMVLPAVALALMPLAYIARLSRVAMIDVSV